MKIKALLSAAAVALMSAPAPAQTAAPAARLRPAQAPAAPARVAQAAPPQQPAAPAPPAATTLFVSGNFLGVRTEEVTRENMSRYGMSSEPRGVGVREVVKGSPAEKAGLREGDVILRFDGEQVSSVRKLTRLIEESRPEHAARLTVSRRGSEQELSATLARREPFAGEFGPVTVFGGDDARRLGEEFFVNPEQWQLKGEELRERLEEMQRRNPGAFTLGSSRRIGVATTGLGKQLADFFGVSQGVLVNSVEANSPAEKAGLRAGDVVTEVDGRQVEDVDDLVRGLGAKAEGEVTLTVVRDRKQRTVRVTPERRQGGMLTPGGLRAAPPVSAAPLRRMRATPLAPAAPRALVAPRVTVTPRAITAPRVTVQRPGRVL